MVTKPFLNIWDEACAERAAETVASAFEEDALYRAILLTTDSLCNDAKISTERRAEYLIPRIREKMRRGALLVEAGNWAAVALWIPPGVRASPLERTEMCLVSREYSDKFADARERHVGNRKVWFLDLIGRHPDRRERGVVRALLEPFLQQARRVKIPVWLEANTAHARDVYEHFGFRVAEEVVIRKGHVDGLGNRVEGGQGISIYAMIFE